MDWTRDGAHWPNRQLSRFVDVRPHRWHVQQSAPDPEILLIHGAGGATHGWWGVLPRLAERHAVAAIDLPGHGFTRMGTRQRSGLKHMAEDVARLAETEGWRPRIIVGHSAGAALALELSAHLGPARIIGLNAALGSFHGVAGWLFPFLAKLFAASPFIPSALARLSSDERRVRSLLGYTGSDLPPELVAHYARLASDPGHVEGTLAMMAQWKIESLLARLGTFDLPVALLVGDEDGTVPPLVSLEASQALPQAEVIHFPGLGHLMQEEAPGPLAESLLRLCGTVPAP